MTDNLVNSTPQNFSTLLRGDADSLHDWLRISDVTHMLRHVAVVVTGAACYGAAMGWWRSPEQALFVAIKFPLIILLTTAGNAILNSMLAPLLGLNISFRQSLFAVLMSFSAASAILGSFSPVTAFLAWSAPPISPETVQGPTYSIIKLIHVLAIAFAGIAGNVRLFRLLVQLGGGRTVGRRVLLAWLAGNLLLGSQLSWILRPFIGSPHLPVEFFRTGIAFEGNFFENVFRTLMNIFSIN